MNKALDLNKLFNAHKKGTLLKKTMKFPMFGSIKYDGNYSTVVVDIGDPVFISSGNHIYDNDKDTIFHTALKGVYLVERIATDGKLGDRNRCNLRGPRGYQTAHGHTYKVHHYLTLDEYKAGQASQPYVRSRELLANRILEQYIPAEVLLHNQEEVEQYLNEVVAKGYEGIMLKHPDWLWADHKTRRTTDLVKYKKRPTADLLVIGIEEGTGKYTGMIGALLVRDKAGRQVSVGSGMSDAERYLNPRHFIGKVVEVFYEQIMDTYIQPTFGGEYEGVLIRHDKTREDID